MLRPEQQELRAKGISGTEIAAVAGISPYGGPRSIAIKKKGLVDTTDETNHHMLRGTHLGPALVRWYEDVTGSVVTHSGAHEQTIVCAKHPIVIATPDGRVRKTKDSKPFAALETKAPDVHTAGSWGEPGTDEIPEHVIPQIVWEMAALDVREAHVAALLYGDLAIYRLEWDEELFRVLLEKAEQFWTDYMLTDKLPPADGSAVSDSYLRQRFPRASMPCREATAEEEKTLRILKVAQEAAKETAELAERAEQTVKELIGDSGGLTCSFGKVSWSDRAGSVSWKKVAEALNPTPEQIEAHRGPSSRTFRANWLAKGTP